MHFLCTEMPRVSIKCLYLRITSIWLDFRLILNLFFCRLARESGAAYFLSSASSAFSRAFSSRSASSIFVRRRIVSSASALVL